MHHKNSAVAAWLTALVGRARLTGRSAVAMARRLAAIRESRVGVAWRTTLAALADTRLLVAWRTTLVPAWQTAVRGPGPAISLVAVPVLTFGLVIGAGALAPTPAAGMRLTASPNSQDRAAAAQRADRGERSAADAVAPLAAGAAAPAATGPAPQPPPPAWVSPMPGAPLSSCFGMRWGAMHQGLDFAGDNGTAIHAIGAGTVFGAGWLYAGYGQSVVIDHGNGYFTHYAHASQILVQPGQQVTAGQVIALEGSTGDATGPHLHFEVHQGLWNQINPAAFLRAHGVALAGC